MVSPGDRVVIALDSLAAAGSRSTSADPVRRGREERGIGQERQPIAPPACEIRDEDLVAEVELGLLEDQPAARAAAAAMERRAELVAERHRRGGGKRGGSG